MKKFVFLLSILISTSIFSQYNWQLCTSSGFASTATSFATGPNGNLYLSGYYQNGPSSWYPVMYVSYSNGLNWSNVTLGYLPIDVATAIIFKGNKLLMAGQDNYSCYVCISTNYGATWTVSSTGINPQDRLKDFALAPNGDIYLLASDNTSFPSPKLYCSINNGASWSLINMSGCSGMDPYSIVFDQNNKLYISGANSFFYNLVYTSTNYGQTCTQASTGIPSTSFVNDLIVGPGQTIYGFGTDYNSTTSTFSPKIFVSTNAGGSWSALNGVTGLGLPICEKAHIHNGFILTHGEGQSSTYIVYRSQLPTTPTVSTANVTDVWDITAVGGGSVTSVPPVLSRGICWNTSTAPTTSDNIAATSAGAGNFTVNITGLTPSTTYYVRAFASNSLGVTYGNEQTFTTEGPSGIKQFAKENALQIYPVPSFDFIYLKWNTPATAKEYSIVDVSGKVVQSSQLKEGENRIDIRNLPVGVYYLRVEGCKDVKVVRG
jgi:hypothetical protein